MARTIPIHYLKEDSTFDAEVTHLMPTSDRWDKLNGFDAHIDDCFTVIVVSKGCGTTDVDFRTVTLSEGQVGIIAPGQVHSNIRVKECEAWMLRISPDMMDNDYSHLIYEFSDTGDVITPDSITMGVLCDAMELLSRLIPHTAEGGGAQGVVFNMLNVVLGIITPQMIKAESRPIPRAAEITAGFKRLLREHLRSQKRPSFYAGRLCLSEVYLNEAVKRSTGMTPSEWISATVILEAKRLLRSTSLSAKEVAHELGIEDHAYFSRMFKKNTGITPLEFRRANLK